MSEVSL